jgi:2-pyrone-4,6-dicarboxylate lactonase
MNKFNRIVHRVAELGWHVDVYFESGTIGEFAPILNVIDHMGTTLAAKGLDNPSFRALLDLQARDDKAGSRYQAWSALWPPASRFTTRCRSPNG